RTARRNWMGSVFGAMPARVPRCASAIGVAGDLMEGPVDHLAASIAIPLVFRTASVTDRFPWLISGFFSALSRLGQRA
ncbi:hypothetical protein ACWEQ5_33785, partial [Streptomyces griseoincarnatus]